MGLGAVVEVQALSNSLMGKAMEPGVIEAALTALHGPPSRQLDRESALYAQRYLDAVGSLNVTLHGDLMLRKRSDGSMPSAGHARYGQLENTWSSWVITESGRRDVPAITRPLGDRRTGSSIATRVAGGGHWGYG